MTAIAPTLSLEGAVRQIWDVLVVGAGPAGAFAARETARHGAAVLLVDKAAFPRYKVCGGCLNASALATLNEAALGGLPAALGGNPIHQLRLAVGTRSAAISLPAGIAVSRGAFDAALVKEAVLSGAHFLPQTAASLDGGNHRARFVALQTIQQKAVVQTRIVLAADGIGGSFLKDQDGFEASLAADARIGVGAIIESGPQFYQPGTIFMACGAGGYAGLVRVEGGRLNIAAALDPCFVRQAGGAGKAVAAMIDEAGLPSIEGLTAPPWRGTPALTRKRRCLAARRLFVLGDAAGYVEPFTGEGIAWALASAAALAPLAREAVKQWAPSLAIQWAKRHRLLLERRQQRCGLVAKLLRQPAFTRAAVGILSQASGLASPWVRRFNAPLAVK